MSGKILLIDRSFIDIDNISSRGLMGLMCSQASFQIGQPSCLSEPAASLM